MKAFLTTYALTKGIIEVEVIPVTGGGVNNRIAFKFPRCCTQYARKGEWHLHKPHAIARAEEMRTAKLASLSKTLAKLEKLTFK